jgi:acyl carrier protein
VTEHQHYQMRLGGPLFLSKRQEGLSTQTKKALQTLFSQTLNLSPGEVGIDNSFFHLGGDSLAAMKLVHLALENAGLQLTVANIFKHPILHELALVVQTTSEEVAEPVILPFSLLKREGITQTALRQCRLSIEEIEDIYPCTTLQEGFMALTVKGLNAYMSQSVHKLPADLDLDRFKQAWSAVVQANAILRTRLIQDPSHGMFQVVTLSDLQWGVEDNLKAYLAQDLRNTMRPGSALTRTTVIQNCHKFTHFVLTIHHALYGGWSWPLIWDQVEAAYESSTKELPKRTFNSFIRRIGAWISLWQKSSRNSSIRTTMRHYSQPYH